MKTNSILWQYPFKAILLVTFSSLLMAASFVYRDNQTLQKEVKQQTILSGNLLAKAIQADWSHDDLWKVYYLLKQSQQGQFTSNFLDDIILVDPFLNIYTSTNPKRFRYGLPLANINKSMEILSKKIFDQFPSVKNPYQFIQLEDKIYFVRMVKQEQGDLGYIILIIPHHFYQKKLYENLANALGILVLTLLVVIPIAWVWGRRQAKPLSDFTACLNQARQDPLRSCKLPEVDYALSSEMLSLRQAFTALMQEIREKELLKEQILTSEKMAALGRLGGGIAHEINNPLGGMLNAISTYRKHAVPEETHSKLLLRTLDLLERGLKNIQSIAQAFLVEVKADAPNLSPVDIEDIRLLLDHELDQYKVQLTCINGLDQIVPLPSDLIRQLLINLLLNAIHHTPQGNEVICKIALIQEKNLTETLLIEIENFGDPIPEVVMQNLFEPFPDGRTESGHGLGLWIVFQIVKKLNGEIKVKSNTKSTQFIVHFPINRNRV